MSLPTSQQDDRPRRISVPAPRVSSQVFLRPDSSLQSVVPPPAGCHDVCVLRTRLVVLAPHGPGMASWEWEWECMRCVSESQCVWCFGAAPATLDSICIPFSCIGIPALCILPCALPCEGRASLRLNDVLAVADPRTEACLRNGETGNVETECRLQTSLESDGGRRRQSSASVSSFMKGGAGT